MRAGWARLQGNDDRAQQIEAYNRATQLLQRIDRAVAQGVQFSGNHVGKFANFLVDGLRSLGQLLGRTPRRRHSTGSLPSFRSTRRNNGNRSTGRTNNRARTRTTRSRRASR